MKDETKTRRIVLQAGIALVVSGGLVEAASAQTKIAQKLVQYQDHPKGKQQCDLCMNWEPPASCKIVDGTIAATGWCVSFAPKGPFKPS